MGRRPNKGRGELREQPRHSGSRQHSGPGVRGRSPQGWDGQGRRGRQTPAAPARHPTRTTSAVATAINPSPRPGNPSPSVVAPDTETGAPTTSESTF